MECATSFRVTLESVSPEGCFLQPTSASSAKRIRKDKRNHKNSFLFLTVIYEKEKERCICIRIEDFQLLCYNTKRGVAINAFQVRHPEHGFQILSEKVK